MIDLITGIFTGGASGVVGMGLRLVQGFMANRAKAKARQLDLEQTKLDQAHELNLQKQELEARAQIADAHAREALQISEAEVTAETLKIGIPTQPKGFFGDLFNGIAAFANTMVRPSATYLLLGIWTFVILQYLLAWTSVNAGTPNAWLELAKILNQEFHLSNYVGLILGFWFADRSIRKEVK